VAPNWTDPEKDVEKSEGTEGSPHLPGSELRKLIPTIAVSKVFQEECEARVDRVIVESMCPNLVPAIGMSCERRRRE
jgi:hypothetical protein